MHACGSAHHFARCLSRLGFCVRLIAPHWVKPQRLQGMAAKNDANDAAAIREAASRPQMRFVAIKSEAQQALLLAQALVHSAELDRHIDPAEQPIVEHAREDAAARLLGQLHGVGPLGAWARVAHLGDMSMFTNAPGSASMAIRRCARC